MLQQFCDRTFEKKLELRSGFRRYLTVDQKYESTKHNEEKLTDLLISVIVVGLDGLHQLGKSSSVLTRRQRHSC